MYISYLPLARVVKIHKKFLNSFKCPFKSTFKSTFKCPFKCPVIPNGHKNEKGENNYTNWLKLYTFEVHQKL